MKTNPINWTEFNGEKFQAFCNDLLSFEFGKNYIPFTAPGGDQGIDGLFDGEYNSKTGKWRFQAKFHHPDTGRVSGFNQLKAQIKKDITENIQDETTVIFITNVELNPNQRKEIKTTTGKTLQENGKVVDFDIWDGAKIYTLLAHHPIVKLWYTDQTKYLIQEYSEYFREELNAAQNTSYALSNKFYYRKNKLEILDQFIRDDAKMVAVISGEAGIGKTRLCIEFFRQYIDPESDWKALVVVTHTIDLQVLQVALSGERNYIVLLDDADKFEEKDIADLLTLVKRIKPNKVKLLLTVRTPFLKQALKQIAAIDQTALIEPIELGQLTKEETVQFLEEELKGYRIGEYFGYFVGLTHGIPIMIMTLLRVIKSGTNLSDIKQDTFLKTYVKQYFDQFIATTSGEKEILKKEVEKIIKLVALIEPIQIDNNDLIKQIASTENISEEDVEAVLLAMKAQHIISGRYQLDIKPDMYSDLILGEALHSTKWLEAKLPLYSTYISNIIKNIAYVNQDTVILANLLQEYINQIDNCNSYQEVATILGTVYTITYAMPLLALETVNKTIAIYTNEQHPLYNDFQRSLTYRNYAPDSTINNLKHILHSLFQMEDYFMQAYIYSGKLYQLLKDNGTVSNIAGFEKSDGFEGFTCKKQNQVLTASKVTLGKVDGEMKFFALGTLKAILRLEFTHTESHLFKKDSIHIYTIHVPENKHVKKLRQETIDLLIEVFQNDSSKEIKEEILKIIVDVPREIFAARNNNYKGKEDIKTVLDFLLLISAQNILELKQKQFIKQQLHRFKRWDKDAVYHTIIDKINKQLAGSDLAEILLDLFNPKYDKNFNKTKEIYKTEAQKLIKNNSGTELGDALVKVVQQSEHTPHYLYDFLYEITTDLTKTKELINHLWTTNREFVIIYCSSMFRQLRFSEEGKSFFWQYIQKLQEENSVKTRDCILNVYSSFRIHDVGVHIKKQDILEQEDSDLITTTFEKSTPENYFNLAWALPILFFLDKSLAVNEIKKFLQNCHERHLDTLFLAFDPVEKENYPEIKELLLHHTIHLNIPYTVERFLNKIIRKDGFEDVFRYIEKRLFFKRKYVLEKKNLLDYEYVPTHTGNTITANLSDEQKNEIFSKILNWFVGFDFESYEHFYTKDVIELFAVNKYIDEYTKVIYTKLIEQYQSDYNKLLNIIQSLSGFKEKNEAFIDLIMQLLKVGEESIQKEEQLKKFKSQCDIALTSVGVKSGTAGQPFEVDLQLKELLENTLNSSKISTPQMKDFFQRVLKSVQANIDRDKYDEGGEIW